MEAKIFHNLAGILHLAPESTIHESCRLSVVQPQIKFFPVIGLHAFIQSYRNWFLVSAGIRAYIFFVPFAFLVYNPNDKSFMFNNVSLDLKTIYLDIHKSNRKTENQIDQNNEICLNTKHLSFDLLDLSFHSPDLSFNPSEQSFHSVDLSFNSSEQSFHSVDLNLNPSEQSFHSVDLNFNPSEQRFNLPDLGFHSMEQSFHSLEQNFNPLEQCFNLTEQCFNPADLNFRNLNPGSKKRNPNLQNVQAWNLSGPDVLTICREEEDPEYFRMPTGGQHAGLSESIQHWKR